MHYIESPRTITTKRLEVVLVIHIVGRRNGVELMTLHKLGNFKQGCCRRRRCMKSSDVIVCQCGQSRTCPRQASAKSFAKHHINDKRATDSSCFTLGILYSFEQWQGFDGPMRRPWLREISRGFFQAENVLGKSGPPLRAAGPRPYCGRVYFVQQYLVWRGNPRLGYRLIDTRDLTDPNASQSKMVNKTSIRPKPTLLHFGLGTSACSGISSMAISIPADSVSSK